MNKFIVWLAGGEQEVKEIKEIGQTIKEYGVDNITIHPRGGIKVIVTNQVNEMDAKKLKQILCLNKKNTLPSEF